MRYQLVLKVSTVLMNQIATIVLARLLLPDDFGLVGLAVIIVGFLAGLADFGIGSALIQGKWVGRPDYETGATLRFILASIATVGTIGIAVPLAWYYNEPDLALVIWALSPLIYLNFLGFVSRVSLTRELKFRGAVLPDTIGRLTSSVTAIAAAFLGMSFWSLVVGPLVGSVVGAVGLYLVRPWKPSFIFNRPVVRRLISTGGTVLASNLLSMGFASLGMLFLATIGLTELGFFSLAYAWAVAIPLSVSNTLDNVAFPVYSAMAGEPVRLRKAYFSTLRYVLWFLLPIGFLVASAHTHIIVVLVGPTWLPASESLRLLAFAGWLLVLAFSYQTFTIAAGRAPEALSVSIIAFVLMATLGPAAAVVAGGTGLALSFLLIGLVLVVFASWRLLSTWQAERSELLDAWLPPLVGASLMYALVSIVSHFLAPTLGSLALIGVLGVASYIPAMEYLTHRRFLAELRRLVGEFVGAGSA